MTGITHVERLREDQVEAAAELLARSFNLTGPQQEKRHRSDREAFLRFVRYCFAHGEPYAGERDGKLTGVALWMPPHTTHRITEQEREFGFDEFPNIFGKAYPHYRRVRKLLLELRAHDMEALHWYLAVVSVDAAHAKTGLGMALLRPILLRADERTLPCYADSVFSGTAAFYQRLGFEVLREGVEPTSGTQYWTFRRTPRRRSGTSQGEGSPSLGGALSTPDVI